VADLVEGGQAGGGEQEFERDLPQFALVVSEAAAGQWHVAALVRERNDRDFYLRSVAVPWPFIIARPAPSNRQNELVFRPEDLSPAGSSPARKLVVNWDWSPVDDATEQLHFFVKRRWRLPFGARCRLRLRLGLTEQPPPRRRFVLRAYSNVVDWQGAGGPRLEEDKAAGRER
jgi:hypothetical protein